MTNTEIYRTGRNGSRRSRRRGVTIVLMALMMASLLGFGALAVDYGLMVADANRMQRACDAAALAGANVLCVSGTDSTAIATDTANARALAVVVAARNKVTVNPNDITFPAFNKIRVPGTATRPFLFAKALGVSSGSVSRFAQAGRMPLRGVNGLVPLAITVDDYNNYKNGTSVELQLIRNQDSDFKPGTVASVDLRPDSSGKSGAVFQADLTTGYSGELFLEQKIDNALTADIVSQGAKLENAMQSRFNDAAAAPYADTGNNYSYPNYPSGDRRIVTLIVADPNPAANGNPLLTAHFFVPVYVQSYRSPNNKVEYLRFRIIPAVSYNSQDPNITIGDDSTFFSGPSAVVLSQ